MHACTFVKRSLPRGARRALSNGASKKASIISVPMNLGQPKLGLDTAPRAILNGGLLNVLKDIGWDVKITPPVITEPSFGEDVSGVNKGVKAKNCLQVGMVSEVIKKSVEGECGEGNFPLILGGDHCIAIGTISAIKSRRPKNAIVWVDAHADINTLETTNSGNMHGMPVAFLLGLVKDAHKLPGFSWFKPVAQPSDIVYIGLRDLDQGEKEIIKRLNIRAYTMYEVDRLGIGKVMEQTLDYIGQRDIHLSYDIDGVDPFYAPHTGTAVTGGLTFREGNYISEVLAETGRLTSMELVEVNPSLRPDIDNQRTIDTSVTIISSAMGKRIL